MLFGCLAVAVCCRYKLQELVKLQSGLAESLHDELIFKILKRAYDGPRNGALIDLLTAWQCCREAATRMAGNASLWGAESCAWLHPAAVVAEAYFGPVTRLNEGFTCPADAFQQLPLLHQAWQRSAEELHAAVEANSAETKLRPGEMVMMLSQAYYPDLNTGPFFWVMALAHLPSSNFLGNVSPALTASQRSLLNTLDGRRDAVAMVLELSLLWVHLAEYDLKCSALQKTELCKNTSNWFDSKRRRRTAASSCRQRARAAGDVLMVGIPTAA